MTADPRLERALPGILADLGAGIAPDYVDSLLGRTAATRQRPAWVFPERWLPMSAITERMTAAPRVPWRAVGVLTLIILALVAVAIAVGGQQRHVPAPFGPAANGLISFVSGGDLYVGDPVTGTSRLLVGGPENDAAPGFSPDGTRIAFLREAGTSLGLFVADDDGSDLREITTYPANDLIWANWAPDSRRLAVIHVVDAGTNQLDLVDATGSGTVETIAKARAMDFFQFRPPGGREILYRALVDGKWGLFVMDADGSNVRTLAEPTVDSHVDMTFTSAAYSADGSRIFYNHGDTDGCCRLWVMNADGTDPHEFVPPSAEAWDGQAVVSPDGAWVAYWHNLNDGPQHGVSVVRADGTGPVIDTGPVLPGTATWGWAPDSSRILMYPNDASATKAYLLDPAGGPWTTVPWLSDGDLDWQRLAGD
jgi:Tol biopolymer transport system component